MGLTKKGTRSPFMPAKRLVSMEQAPRRVRFFGLHTGEDEIENHGEHEAALDVVQEVLVPHPCLGLAAHLAFLAVLPARRHQGLALGEVVAQVLHDEGRLCKHDRLRGTGCRDGDGRGLAERVDLLELGRGQHVLLAMVDLEVVRDLQLLQQPENALSPRSIEPVELDFCLVCHVDDAR